MDIRPEDLLAGVPGQTGTLVLSLDGAVISATGDLKSDTKAASVIYQMLLDANALVSGGSQPQAAFRRLTVSFQQHSFAVTVHNDKICAVKRATM